MSNIVFYIKLERYLRQWLVNALGDPVQFPAGSNENAVIRRFIRKLPKDQVPEMAGQGLTAIRIPDSKAKPPQYYNYMGQHAKACIIEAIEDLFRRNLWAEIGYMKQCHCSLNSIITAWCEMHGIDDDYTETVRQKYYRMRTAYTKKGIFLSKMTRNSTDS